MIVKAGLLLLIAIFGTSVMLSILRLHEPITPGIAACWIVADIVVVGLLLLGLGLSQ